jgi:putative acetyltransferase
MNNQINIRVISETDNIELAKIIRACLSEFNAVKPGTVYYDDTTDHLYEIFKKERSKYFVVEIDGKVAGGAGIYPTSGLEDDTCELVKMYLLKSARGKALGKILLQKCIAVAKEEGYKKMYLETMPELKLAIPMYQKYGFIFLNGPKGHSGHTGCDVWMMKELT